MLKPVADAAPEAFPMTLQAAGEGQRQDREQVVTNTVFAKSCFLKSPVAPSPRCWSFWKLLFQLLSSSGLVPSVVGHKNELWSGQRQWGSLTPAGGGVVHFCQGLDLPPDKVVIPLVPVHMLGLLPAELQTAGAVWLLPSTFCVLLSVLTSVAISFQCFLHSITFSRAGQRSRGRQRKTEPA